MGWHRLAVACAVLAVFVPSGVWAAELDSVGLVDPEQGRWYLRDQQGDVAAFFFGNPGDIAVMGDWDCDGVDTPGLFRTSDAFAYLSNANRSQIADIRFFFGDPADLPLAGDWDGDGCDTLSIYRPREQRFFIVNELGQDEGGLGAAAFSFGFGNPGDQPVVGDWDGDGVDEVGLHRESTGFFYWRNTLTTGVADGSIFFGDPGDRFVAGDWGDVDGRDTPAVFRPADATFYLRHSLTQGPADSQVPFGVGSLLPVAGRFGDLVPTPGVMFPAPPDAGDVAVVQSVTDGDTITVRFGTGVVDTVRLIGIDAPEGGDCLSVEATARLTALVDAKAVSLVRDVSDRDRFDRLLRYVYLDGTFINETIVREGLATAVRFPPDTTQATILEAAQVAAQAAQVGLWDPSACGTGDSSGDLSIVALHPDAPGNDNFNKNGEWVDVRNRGATAVGMGGWVMRDVANHRYRYPTSFVLQPGATVRLFSGCGTNTSTSLYWCNPGTAVWNNDGDTATLLNPAGDVVDTWSY